MVTTVAGYVIATVCIINCAVCGHVFLNVHVVNSMVQSRHKLILAHEQNIYHWQVKLHKSLQL